MQLQQNGNWSEFRNVERSNLLTPVTTGCAGSILNLWIRVCHHQYQQSINCQSKVVASKWSISTCCKESHKVDPVMKFIPAIDKSPVKVIESKERYSLVQRKSKASLHAKTREGWVGQPQPKKYEATLHPPYPDKPNVAHCILQMETTAQPDQVSEASINSNLPNAK